MIDIKSIWENQKSQSEKINKTKIFFNPNLNCYLGTNQITGQFLFIMSISKDINSPDLKNFKFKGIEIFAIELVETKEITIYLLDNELKDIFTLFVQNIIEDISDCKTESEALSITINIITKWKNLFDKIHFNGLTIEKQKGLIGELLFINELMVNKITCSKILTAWIGTDYEDKDFRFGNIGVEIKFTTSKQPKISVSNEGQLDTQNLSRLFIVLYSLEEVPEMGISLFSLVESIKEKLQGNLIELNFFTDKLRKAGYSENDKENYKREFSLKKTYYFEVDNDFPKITKSSLPLGIFNASYNIEISSVENYLVDLDLILQNI